MHQRMGPAAAAICKKAPSSQLLPPSGAAAATALRLPHVPLLQVLCSQRGVQRSTQRQHSLVQGEARRVQAVHCGAGVVSGRCRLAEEGR